MTINQSPATSDGIQVVLETADQQSLQDLMTAIDHSDIPARTETIRPAGTSGSRNVEIDLNELTNIQLETLELAVECGYYERPREIDLGGLAEKLGISKSATSQRLRGAERNLVNTALR